MKDSIVNVLVMLLVGLGYSVDTDYLDEYGSGTLYAYKRVIGRNCHAVSADLQLYIDDEDEIRNIDFWMGHFQGRVGSYCLARYDVWNVDGFSIEDVIACATIL